MPRPVAVVVEEDRHRAALRPCSGHKTGSNDACSSDNGHGYREFKHQNSTSTRYTCNYKEVSIIRSISSIYCTSLIVLVLVNIIADYQQDLGINVMYMFPL